VSLSAIAVVVIMAFIGCGILLCKEKGHSKSSKEKLAKEREEILRVEE